MSHAAMSHDDATVVWAPGTLLLPSLRTFYFTHLFLLLTIKHVIGTLVVSRN